MRYTPFGSASVQLSDSSSLASYALSSIRALRVDNALYALTGSKGPQGDPGTGCTTEGPYDSYPPTFS